MRTILQSTLFILLAANLLAVSPGCRLGFEPAAYCFDDQDCDTTDATTTDSADGTQDGTDDTVADAQPPDAATQCTSSEDCDLDGVIEENDNCPGVWNPSQLNWDSDVWGDECDPCPFVDQGLTGGICPGPVLGAACDRSGHWRGTVVSRLNGVPTVHVRSALLTSDGSVLPDDGTLSAYSCPSPRVLQIHGLQPWNVTGTDAHAVLILDNRHELAAGHLVDSETGRVVAGTQILLTRVGVIPDGLDPETAMIPEGQVDPNNPNARSWMFRGVGSFPEGATGLSLTGQFTQEPASAGQGEPPSIEGTLVLHHANAPEGESFQLKTLDVPESDGPFFERPGSQANLMLVVGDADGQTVGWLNAAGFTNLSRDFVTMSGTLSLDELELSVGLVLTRNDPDQSFSDVPLAMIGSGRTHSLRGIVHTAPSSTGASGWVIHPHAMGSEPSSGLLNPGQSSDTDTSPVILLEEPKPAIQLGATDMLQAHHVCISRAPGGHVGVIAVCKTGDDSSCDRSHDCVASLGVVVPWTTPTAAQSSDLDLDGTGSKDLDKCIDKGDTNQSGLWDSCPCLLQGTQSLQCPTAATPG